MLLKFNSLNNISVQDKNIIFVIDKSGSMGNNLPSLNYPITENTVKSRLKQIIADNTTENDLISLITFSDNDKVETVFSGMSKKHDLSKLIDKITTDGCTEFSNALVNVNKIYENLKDINDNLYVVFFTDGCLCPDTESERQLISEEMDKIGKVASVYANIGFGSYYDVDLLNDMSSKAVNGITVHESSINDFSKDVLDIINQRFTKCSIQNISSKSDINILYDPVTKSIIGKKDLSGLKINPDSLVYSTNSISNIELTDNSWKVEEVTNNNIYQFDYAIAYTHLLNGDNAFAINHLQKTNNDKYFINKISECFTLEERKQLLEELKQAVYEPSVRMKEGKHNTKSLNGRKMSFMSLLNVLSTDRESLMLPINYYKRIGLAVDHSDSLFIKDKQHPSKISKYLSYTEDKLNVNIKFMITGHVDIPDNELKKVGLVNKPEAAIYRDMTLIKDGKPNVDEITVVVSPSTFSKLIVDLPKSAFKIKDESRFILDIYPKKMNVLNLSEAMDSISIDKILQNVITINQLKAKLKVLRSLQKENDIVIEEDKQKTIKESKRLLVFLDDKQKSLLESYGLKGFTYNPINKVKYIKDNTDYYTRKDYSFNIDGWSSLPSVQDSVSGKKKNEPAIYMKQVYDDMISILNNCDIYKKENILSKTIESLEEQLLITKNFLSTVKMTYTLISDKSLNDLDIDKKGNYRKDNMYIKKQKIQEEYTV